MAFFEIGIDYSAELISKAKNRVKNAKVLKMNFLKKLKFDDEEFDGVWASASLLHIPKNSLNNVVLEIKRILKTNGIFFISVKEGKKEKMVKDDYGSETRFFSFFKKKELIKKLEILGFQVPYSYEVPDEKLRVRSKKKKQKWIILYSVKQ